ncbi:hypothetical protein LXA43DRAFT_1181951 [Ganoderma leucocontextum]|nr:hypothetical protein LXA43DRAFT_1181951 [Ganoderma leucocontextum]
MSGIHPLHVATSSKFPGVPLILALPFDLECAILDQVSNDFVALQACTLVCREWASIAQQRLFRSVLIDLEPVQGTTGDGQSCDPTELQRFLDFLDGSPHLARSVLTVTVHAGTIPSLAGFIRALLSKAPRLRALVLSMITLDPDTISALPLLNAPTQSDIDGPSPGAAIDMLELSWCEVNGARSLLDILRLFSRIRQITVFTSDGRSDIDGSDVLDLRPSTVPVIESVVLNGVHSDLPALLNSALRASFLPDGALQSIRVRLTHTPDLEGLLLPCLRGAHGRLRKLHLDLDRRLLLVVPLCTALESVTFAIEGKHQSRTPYMDYLRAVFPAYARLVCPPPPPLRSIMFKVQEGFQEYEDEGVREVLEAIADGEHWRRLDAELSAHRELARFAFVFYNRPGHPGAEDKGRIVGTLERVLLRLVKRRILGVELKPPPTDRQALLYEI